MSQEVKTWLGLLSGFGAVLIWAGFPVITELAFIQSELSIQDLTAIRFSVSGLILLPFMFRISATQYRRFLTDSRHLLLLFLLLCGSGAPYILIVSLGIEQAEASHFGIIVPSSMMIFTALGATLWLREPFRRHTIIGNVIILIGIAVIAQASLRHYQSEYIVGDALLLLGGFLWSGFTLSSRYFGLNPVHNIALVSVSSALVYLPYYFTTTLMHGQPLFWSHNGGAVLIQAVYQGVLLSVVALVFYSLSIAKLGAAKASLFAAGMPGLTLLLTSFLPRQNISWVEFVGASLVTLGMLISLNFLSRLRRG